VQANGLGYLVDLGVVDYALGLPNFDSTVNIFPDAGAILHIGLGMLAAVSGGPWGLGISAAFGGYELAKLNSGEAPTRIAGTLIEFGLGALLVAFLMWGARG
jgi:hypothetical protein